LTNARDAAAQYFVGQLVLGLWKRLQRSLTVGAARAQARGLGTCRRLCPLATLGTVAALASLTTVAIATATAIAITAPTFAVTTTTAAATTTTPTIVSIAATAATTTTLGQNLRDQRLVTTRTKQLEERWFLAGALGCKDRGDHETIEVSFGLHLHHIAYADTVGKEGAVQLTLRLLRTSSAPRESAVVE
jgi:hypothetical protein